MLARAVVPVRGQPVDVDRAPHREVLDLRVVAVPRLDLEPVDQAPPEVADHAGVGRRAQVGVALEALEQHVEALAEVARTEVVEPGRLHRLPRRRSAPSATSG